jgi:RNA polymerase sigma-B factor
MSVHTASRPVTLPRTADGLRDGDAIVRRYKQTGDRALRERAVSEFMPLARRLARRFHRGREPLEDLEQVAYVGLLKAVERFDPDHGARFSSFAMPTISGELRRHYRDTTWALHVPRGVQEAALDVARAAARLSSDHGRSPRIGELVAETGLDAEQVTEALHARDAQHVRSLDQPLRGDEEDVRTIGDAIGFEDDRLDLIDHRVTVAPLIRALPPGEREVLHLRFALDMTQSQIAARVGCSQMQVSRLLRRAIAQLSQASDEPQPLLRGGVPAQLRGAADDR